MASDLTELSEQMWSLKDPFDHAVLARVAADAARLAKSPSAIESVVKTIESIFNHAHAENKASFSTTGTGTTRTLTMWALIDKLSKHDSELKQTFRVRMPSYSTYALLTPQIVDEQSGQVIELTPKCTYNGKQYFDHFEQILKSFQLIFGKETVLMWKFKFPKSHPQVTASAVRFSGGSNDDPAASASVQQSLVPRPSASSTGGVLTTSIRYIGGYAGVNANNTRPDAYKDTINTKTIDSTLGVTRATEMAPLAPSESDPETGVKIGNYPAGVRFLRDAIRGCGGALPLTLLEERLSQVVSEEMKQSFGDLRQFLFIHQPTFNVVNEENQWIVRITGDEAPDQTKDYSWKIHVCPYCSKLVPGRNLVNRKDGGCHRDTG